MTTTLEPSDASRSPCPPLPQETLCDILAHHLSAFTSSLEAQAARFIFGRVCRAWYTAARSTREFAVDGSSRAEMLRKRLVREKKEHEQRGESYQIQVKKFHLKTGSGNHSKENNKGKKFADLLDLFIDNLDILECSLRRLMGSGKHSTFSAALDQMWPRLTNLRVLSIESNRDIDLDNAQHLLGHLPNLTHLSLRPAGSVRSRGVHAPHSPLLTHLEISTANPQWGSNLSRALRTFLGPRLNELKLSVFFSSAADLDDLIQSLIPAAPALSHFHLHLTLTDSSFTAIPQFSAFFNALSTLSSLHFVLKKSLWRQFVPAPPYPLLHYLDLDWITNLPLLQKVALNLAHLPLDKQNSVFGLVNLAPTLQEFDLVPPENWTATTIQDLKEVAEQKGVKLVLRSQ